MSEPKDASDKFFDFLFECSGDLFKSAEPKLCEECGKEQLFRLCNDCMFAADKEEAG
jgi:hypothetical protein